MVQLRRPMVSLSLLLLAACGAKDGTTATSSSTGDSETGPGVTTTGLSMSSSPTTGDEPGTTTAVTSSGPSSDTNTTSTTGIDPSATVTTVDPTTGDPVECQIEQPPPGSCDGAAPKQPAIDFAGKFAPRLAVKGAQGPKVVVDDADDEQFATTGEGCNFICPPDTPGVNECDIFAQDCDPGEKCNAWAD